MPNCTVCQKRSYSAYCVAHKPRTAIKTNVQPVRTTPIKKVGTNSAYWRRVRGRWFKANPGSKTCHYCGKYLTPEEVTLDHLIPRSRAPKLRFEFSNLVPCCYACNGLKGSVAHDEYKHECY